MEHAEKLAESLGCRSNSISSCLQSASVKDLIEHSQHVSSSHCNSIGYLNQFIIGPWAPVVDSFASKPFLPVSPKTALETSGRDSIASVPILLGFNADEGLKFTAGLSMAPDDSKARFVDDMKTCGLVNLFGVDQVTRKETDIFDKLMIDYNAINNDGIDFKGLTELLGDAVYGLPSHAFSEFLRENNFTAFRYILCRQDLIQI